MDPMFSVLTLATLFTLWWGVIKVMPGMSAAVLGQDAGRSGEMDGLRGVLALLVVVHHCTIVKIYCATGVYESAPGNFDNLAGEASVALFFVSTAYLLWGRVLRHGGIPDWSKFYLSRFKRLMPMYMVSVAGVLAIVAVESGFSLREPMGQILIEIGRWMGFSFFPFVDINGVHNTFYIQVVMWTLQYEWQFYLWMPLMVLFHTGIRPWMLYISALAAAFLLADNPLYGYFVAGAVVAHLQRLPAVAKLPKLLWGVLGTVALAILINGYHDIYGMIQVVLIALIFMGAISGAGPWMVLRWSALRFLGIISYSIYLLHHMILHILSQWILGPDAFAALQGVQFAAAILAVGGSAVILATVAYLKVEKPWMQAAPVSVKAVLQGAAA
jgi:peptidoglycan/LPS O-acetylase OafA/YrhL